MSNKIPTVICRTEKIELGNGEIVQIKGHRGSDYNILRAISKVENKTFKLNLKLNKITNIKNKDGTTVKKNDTDLTDKEIDQLLKIKDSIEDLKDEFMPLVHQLSQRGLKRFYYPDKKTDELDDLPDIELNEGEKLLIHRSMLKLDQPFVSEDDIKNEKKT